MGKQLAALIRKIIGLISLDSVQLNHYDLTQTAPVRWQVSWSECNGIEKGDALWGFVWVGLNLKHMERHNLLAGIWPLPVVLLFREGLRGIKGLLITLTQDAGGVKVREGKWQCVICLFSYGTKWYHDTRLSASEQNRNRTDVPASCRLWPF